MRKIFVILLMLAFSFGGKQAFAQTEKQTRIYIEDMSVNPGDELEVKLLFDGNVIITEAQFYLEVPSGFEFVNQGGRTEKYAISVKDQGEDVFSVSHNFNEEKTQLRVVMEDPAKIGTPGTSGELATIKIKVPADLTPGNHIFKLTNVVASDKSAGRYPTDDAEVKVQYFTNVSVSVVSENEQKGTVSVSPEIGASVMGGTSLTLTASPKEGYVFEKWSDGTNDLSTEATFVYTVSDNVTITAFFKLAEYDITYVLGGGSLPEGVTNPATYTIESDDITLNNPIMTGYTFTGWTGTGLTEATATVTIAKGSTGERNYTATYQINKYKLTFMADGEIVSEEEVEYASTIVVPSDPEKDGYIFTGWTPDVEEKMPASDLTYTAVFTKIINDEHGNNYIKDGEDTGKLIEISNDYEDSGIIAIPSTIDYNGKQLTIVGISDDAFDNVDKSKVTVIDLSGTGVTNITVDRTNGLFKGFSENTLIILPEGTGNTAAEGEKNVVIGNMCTELSISEANDFNSPIAFKVKHAVFDRIFTPGVPSTIYLPFSIPSDEASELGTFHTFKEISSEGTAVFNTAETGEIQANTPYIFIPKATVSAIDITDPSGNINVKVTGSSIGTNGYLTGTTSAIVWDANNVPENIYGFAAEERDNVSIGSFVKAKEGASIAAYRAYLVIDDAATARSMYRAVISGTTGIKDAQHRQNNTKEEWYSINGVQLKSAPMSRGLYIKNGNKIIIE